MKAAGKERNRITDEITNAYVQQSMSGQLTAEMNKNKPAAREAQLVIKVNEQHAWIPARDQPVSGNFRVRSLLLALFIFPYFSL